MGDLREDTEIPNFMVVNDRVLLIENIGAVQQMGATVDNIDQRVQVLENGREASVACDSHTHSRGMPTASSTGAIGLDFECHRGNDGFYRFGETFEFRSKCLLL